MGLRVATFAAAFNVLLWLSRSTLSVVLERRFGAVAAMAAACVAPFALLTLARRLSPDRASAFAAVASVSLLASGMASSAG